MHTTDSIDTLSTASIKRTMRTALHEHELHQVNPLEVYGAYGGHWKCDNCSAESNATQYPFHCRRCSFDLCYSCAQTNVQHNSLAHQHPLFYVETSRLFYQNQNGLWKCQVCKKTSNELRETFSYHCPTCNDFDICRSCFEPRRHPIHIHVLDLMDTTILYPESRGNWVCDICCCQSRPWEKFAYHCSECSNFDVCPDCYKPLITPLHNHPLYKASPHYVYAQFHGGWQCDNCGSAFNNPTLQSYPWHCSLCSYDLCQNCVGNESVDQTGPPPQHFGRTRSFQTPAAPGFSFNRQPEENPWVTRNRLSPSSDDDVPQTFTTERGNAVAFPEDTDDNSKCIICMEQPKNATVIHGDTGHCCCCWACAQVLKQRGDPCPICRAPIDHVIRQFNA